MMLPNGTVLPHGLVGIDHNAMSRGDSNSFNNTSLKAGIVVKSYAKDDDQNVSKMIPEYDVVVIESFGNMAPVSKTYRHCVSAQGLGSIADYFEMSLRAQEKQDNPQRPQDFDNQDGATVLILCLDGHEEKAIIVTAIKHPDRESKLDGTTLLAGEFNGASMQVKKDGAVNLKTVGPTDSQGLPTNKDYGATSFDVENDGSVQVKHQNITMRMDKKGGYSVTSKLDQSYSTTEESFSVTAKKNLNVKTEVAVSVDSKDWMVKLSGSATTDCQTFKLKAATEFNLESAQISMKGSSQIMAKAPQITLDGLCMLGGSGGTPIPVLSTQYIGVGNLGVPTISAAVGPFATKVFAL